jgi:hypothetical protein
MMRVVMRGFMIVLALVLVVASAGTVLCEKDCAAGGHAASAVAMTPMSVGTSHCDGEQVDLSAQDSSTHHGNSGGHTKHGAHLHSGIVATITAQVLVSPPRTSISFAVAPTAFGVRGSARSNENFWKNNSSPPINSLSVFATGVLRI